MITYPNAKDENGKDVNINDVTPEMRESTQFFCWGCGKRMVAVIDGKIAKHFRHFEECDCKGESYIHNRGKAVFKETFEASEHFYIELNGNRVCPRMSQCPLRSSEGCSRPGTFKHDLKEVYDSCELEKMVDDYRPDVLLRSSKHPESPLFIEIFHTSPSKNKKLQSGYRLIEIKVDSEKDIKRIQRAHLKESDQNVFFGFKKQTCKDETVSGRHVHVFRVSETGNVIFEEGSCSRFIPYREEEWKGYRYGILVEDEHYPGNVDFIKFCLTTAYYKGFLKRDCRLCKHLDYLAGEDGFEFMRAVCSLDDFSTMNPKQNPVHAIACSSYEYYFKGSGAEDVITSLSTYYDVIPGEMHSFREVCDSSAGETLFNNRALDAEYDLQAIPEGEKKYLNSLYQLIDEEGYIRLNPDYLYQAYALAKQRGLYVVMEYQMDPMSKGPGVFFRAHDKVVLKLSQRCPWSNKG